MKRLLVLLLCVSIIMGMTACSLGAEAPQQAPNPLENLSGSPTQTPTPMPTEVPTPSPSPFPTPKMIVEKLDPTSTPMPTAPPVKMESLKWDEYKMMFGRLLSEKEVKKSYESMVKQLKADAETHIALEDGMLVAYEYEEGTGSKEVTFTVPENVPCKISVFAQDITTFRLTQTNGSNKSSGKNIRTVTIDGSIEGTILSYLDCGGEYTLQITSEGAWTYMVSNIPTVPIEPFETDTGVLGSEIITSFISPISDTLKVTYKGEGSVTIYQGTFDGLIKPIIKDMTTGSQEVKLEGYNNEYNPLYFAISVTDGYIKFEEVKK